ncbi:MAG: hypothetical protein KAS32_11140 [Candidatus Peribacteraceae bacterium]|nr:hypothetical protein [Candidatus Peribacteraceae bacterium]
MMECPSCKNSDDDKYEIREVEDGDDIVCKVCRATVFGFRRAKEKELEKAMEWARKIIKQIKKERGEI